MSRKALGITCAFLVVLFGGNAQASESETDWLSGMPKPADGEDPAVVSKNYFRNLWAEHTNEGRETTVKFDDDLEARCPLLTSLFFSTGHRLKFLTPNFSLDDAIVYAAGSAPDGTSADVIVQNASCRYVLAVKRFEREDQEEKVVPVKYIPTVPRVFKPRPDNIRDDKRGLGEQGVSFVSPSKRIDFTGIAFFATTTFTIYLANADKDLKIASESDFLTHTYKVEIKNAQAALRILINKEFYSNGQWVNAYGK